MSKSNSCEMFISSLKGKRVLVVGLGLQGGGVGVARFFSRHGSLVTVTDTKSHGELSDSITALKDQPNITYHLGGHHNEDFLNTDLIIKGPSVRWDNPYILKALQVGIPVTMETALFVKYAGCKTIGITGTRGKSTTTNLIFQTLNQLYKKGKVYMSGNVPGTCAIELLDTVKDHDLAVLELSSWQLSGFHHEKISPNIALFTNLYPDHLNYYLGMTEYEHDKNAIAQYQQKGDVYIDGRKMSSVNHHEHNKSCAKAVCIAVLGDLSSVAVDSAISSVSGLPMRQEIISIFDDITVINDSTSTTPNALQTALKSYADKPVILIMGGNAKKLPLADLITEITSARQIKKIFFMPGTFTDEIHGSIQGTLISDFEQLIKSATQYAQELNQPCYLLFSPGATSFAQFKNEFDRGNRFNKLISDIIK